MLLRWNGVLQAQSKYKAFKSVGPCRKYQSPVSITKWLEILMSLLAVLTTMYKAATATPPHCILKRSSIIKSSCLKKRQEDCIGWNKKVISNQEKGLFEQICAECGLYSYHRRIDQMPFTIVTDNRISNRISIESGAGKVDTDFKKPQTHRLSSIAERRNSDFTALP